MSAVTSTDHTPVATESKPNTAETAPKVAPRKSATKPKPTAKRAPGKKVGRYPEWVPDAVARARRLSGAKTGDPKTPSYAGPAQHIRARREVTEMLGGDVTPDAILRLTGVKSFKVLRDIATWQSDRDAMKPMRPLAAKFRDDGWLSTRYLSAVLTVWCDDLRADAKAAKRS